MLPRKQHPHNRYWLALAFTILVSSLYFSTYQIQRHRAFQTSLDLVSVEQPLWNTLHGRFMQTTYYPVTGQIVNRFEQTPTENLLADHFQPTILALLLPYALFPRSETLMIILSICVALGAIPMYRITIRRLEHPGWGLAFASAYLLLPAVQTNLAYDIHLTNFLPPLLLFALDAMESGPIWQWVLFALLAMGCREDMLLFTGWGMLLLAPRHRRWAAAGLLLMGLVIGVVFYGLIVPNFGGQGDSTYLSRMLPLGTEISQQGILNMIGQAGYWKAVFLHGLGYNLRLGLPLLFLYVLHAPSLLAAAPMIVQNSLSWWPAQWDPNTAHYSAPIIPFLLLGTLAGLQRLTGLLRQRHANYNWQSVIGVALFSSVAASQWMAGYTPLAQNFHWPAMSGRESSLNTILAQIPVEANLSAEPRLAGHLARRPMLRFFPDGRDADWVMVDAWLGHYPYYTPDQETFRIWQTYLADPTWETAYARNGVILLRKGAGPPQALAEAFTPSDDFSLRSIQAQFTDGTHEIWLTGAAFIPVMPGQYALCTDWIISSSLTPTISVTAPLAISARPLTGLAFYPQFLSQPGRMRDCSPLILSSGLPVQAELAVLNAAGNRLSLAQFDPGTWGKQATDQDTSILFNQTEP